MPAVLMHAACDLPRHAYRVANTVPCASERRHVRWLGHCRENVYNSRDRKALRGLKWLNSLGNHDVLGLKSGVDAQVYMAP